MSEDLPMDCATTEQGVVPKVTIKKKRDIFRFNGQEDMSINLDHVYKITRSAKRITFQGLTSDFVEFQDEEGAKKVYDQIISIWSSDVLE